MTPSGELVIATSARVVVLRLADGSPVTEFVVPEYQPGKQSYQSMFRSLSSPVVGSDGTVYVADGAHHVYALRDTAGR